MLSGLRTHPVWSRVIRFQPVAVVGALVIVLGTMTATAEPPMASVVYGRLGSQHVRLSMPPTDTPKGIAVYFHGQNGNVDNRMDDPWLQGLVHAGWIVASSDFHSDSWGNEKSTVDTQQLVAWAEKETGGVPIRMFISGSMGSTVALNAITHGVPSPACFYGVKPAVDITKMHHVPGADRIIATAFGGPVPTDRNPVDTIDQLSTATRYRLVTSPEDTWVVESQNTDKLAAGLEARGAQVSILKATGPHDDPSHFNNADLLQFAAGCAVGAKADPGSTASAAHPAG